MSYPKLAFAYPTESVIGFSSVQVICDNYVAFLSYIVYLQDRRWNADKPSATLDP